MEQLGKRVNMYRGIWFAYIAAFLFPAIVFTLFYVIINKFFDHPKIITVYISLAFSGIFGFLYMMITFFHGLADDIFLAFTERVRETRELFGGYFTKLGFKYYSRKFVEDGGIIFWTMLLIMLAFAGISAYGFVKFFEWYNTVPR